MADGDEDDHGIFAVRSSGGIDTTRDVDIKGGLVGDGVFFKYRIEGLSVLVREEHVMGFEARYGTVQRPIERYATAGGCATRQRIGKGICGKEILVGVDEIAVVDYYVCGEKAAVFQFDTSRSGARRIEDNLGNWRRELVVNAVPFTNIDESFDYLCDFISP